jgi:1-phosphofructokinase family hexose kinase
MIVTVTPNPALDLTWTASHIVPGESHRVATVVSRAGGKGVNVARVAAQQGFETLAVAPIGGATGDEFAADLVAAALESRLVPVAATSRRTAAFVDTGTGVTTLFNEFGESLLPGEWDCLEAAVASVLGEARVLVLSGSLPPDAPADVAARFVSLARERGIPIIVDTSGPALLAAADARADVLKPNREELLSATGETDPVTAARSLIARGAGLVLVSLGADGMIAVSADDPHHPIGARLPHALVGNATGAGDAAVAAVACRLASGERRVEALLRAAIAWSAAAVLMPLAGEISPRHEDLARELILVRHSDASTEVDI